MAEHENGYVRLIQLLILEREKVHGTIFFAPPLLRKDRVNSPSDTLVVRYLDVTKMCVLLFWDMTWVRYSRRLLRLQFPRVLKQAHRTGRTGT